MSKYIYPYMYMCVSFHLFIYHIYVKEAKAWKPERSWSGWEETSKHMVLGSTLREGQKQAVQLGNFNEGSDTKGLCVSFGDFAACLEGNGTDKKIPQKARSQDMCLPCLFPRGC